jgi:ribosome maturation factor RimP
MSEYVLGSIERIAEPVVTAEGMEIVDIEYRRENRGWVLRLYIDKEGGVTIGDCSNISSQVSHLIDVYELISHPVILEVSSPGLDRPLKKEKDFVKYNGRLIKIKTHDPIGKRKNFKGRLLDYSEGVVKIDIGVEIISLPLDKIAKANLEYEYHFPSFRQKPESSVFKQLRTIWTPVFTGVTTFYEFISFRLSTIQQ